jgi:hypothetical protein
LKKKGLSCLKEQLLARSKFPNVWLESLGSKCCQNQTFFMSFKSFQNIDILNDLNSWIEVMT